MNISLTIAVKRKINKLVKRHPELVQIIDTRISILQIQPQHPILRLHKLSGERADAWSISITRDLRMLFMYVDGGILVVDIGSHDDVY